ncbi:M15 family metallopeptidase [Microbacterium sp. MC2]
MTEPDPPRARRPAVPGPRALARHARRQRRRRLWMPVAVAGVIVLAATVAVTASITAGEPTAGRDGVAAPEAPVTPPTSIPDPPTVTFLPVPSLTTEPDEPDRLCDDPAVRTALEGGTDAEVIAAVGGGESFRTAVAAGVAPCLDLGEADRLWVVVNKRHPLDPVDYWPVPQARAEGVQRTSGGHMRADVAAALAQLAAAAAEGPGPIGANSGFRSYDFQVSTYSGYVSSRGRAAADLLSARPGHSEHQTGLAVDVVACGDGCGGIESFGRTAQAEWVAANAWRFGFVVRYEQGQTRITGYEAEPWHLRYLGVDLAAAYHDGGHHSLEAFFGLDPAPDYG